MRITVEDCLAAIDEHTRGLAAAATGNLDAPIEHCPGWSMADLVWHLTEVHRFWEHVARTRPTQPPEDRPEVERPADDELVAGMLLGMGALIDTLRSADQDAPCWTWGLEENVGFITRHQVQEAAVHHWDAAHAAQAQWAMAPVVAMDAVDEFLTHSAANTRWPMPDAAPMGGTFWFCACTSDVSDTPVWQVFDGEQPGTVGHRVFDDPAMQPPEIDGPAAGGHGRPEDLLLWLYRRIDDPTSADGLTGDLDVVERFRKLTNTD